MDSHQHSDPASRAGASPEFFSLDRLTERMVARGEDPREFKKLYEQLLQEWQPANATEWHYLECILRHRWWLTRMEGMERTVYARIGRAMWEQQEAEQSMRQVLGPAMKPARAALKEIAQVRARSVKSLGQFERRLQRMQRARQRYLKRGPTGRLRAADFAGLEPGSKLIQ